MPTAHEQLEQAQALIAASTLFHELPEMEERLLFYDLNGGLHVEVFVDPSFGHFPDVLEVLMRPEVAEKLLYLAFRGPDEGANGTRNWDLTPLMACPTFPRLAGLFIEPSPPEFHNRSIVAVDYDEDGMLAQLLDRMPSLCSLTVPSAPDARFFQRSPHPLQELRIEAGYDTQGFVRNLADADCFPELASLDFTDYCETYAGDVQEIATSFYDYRELFASAALNPVKVFTLRNPNLAPDELRALKQIRPHLLFRVIRTSSEYIR